jgi:hypothetical protein
VDKRGKSAARKITAPAAVQKMKTGRQMENIKIEEE